MADSYLPKMCAYLRSVLLLKRGKECDRLKNESLLPHRTGERLGDELGESLHNTSLNTESED